MLFPRIYAGSLTAVFVEVCHSKSNKRRFYWAIQLLTNQTKNSQHVAIILLWHSGILQKFFPIFLNFGNQNIFCRRSECRNESVKTKLPKLYISYIHQAGQFWHSLFANLFIFGALFLMAGWIVDNSVCSTPCWIDYIIDFLNYFD